MDLSQKEDQLSASMCVVDEIKKSCTMCQTEKTPLWRSGPSGPKSLCNACGIKHRKRKALMCKNQVKNNKQSLSNVNQAALSQSLSLPSTETLTKYKAKFENSGSSNRLQSVKVGLAAFGKGMVSLQKQRSIRRYRSEEEEAAVLLMSLSCGSSIFA